jgi:hypothetical protein
MNLTLLYIPSVSLSLFHLVPNLEEHRHTPGRGRVFRSSGEIPYIPKAVRHMLLFQGLDVRRP